MYPDDFAGVFINSDGRAVFRIVEGHYSDSAGLRTKSLIPNDAIIMPAEFSLNSLEATADTFFNFIYGNRADPTRNILSEVVIGGGACILTNIVFVEITRNDDEIMQYLDKVILSLGLDMRQFRFDYTHGMVNQRGGGCVDLPHAEYKNIL